MGQDPLTSNQLNTFKLFIHQINLINEFIIFALKRINISINNSGFCINEYGRSSFSSKLLIFFFFHVRFMKIPISFIFNETF